MEMNLHIVYRQGKQNVAIDALSRVAHLMAIQAVSSFQPAWIQEVLNTYATDPQAQQMLAKLAISSPDPAVFFP
jgi:hypothetical protein